MLLGFGCSNVLLNKGGRQKVLELERRLNIEKGDPSKTQNIILFLASQFTSLSDIKQFLLISGLLCPRLCSEGIVGEILLPRLPLYLMI